MKKTIFSTLLVMLLLCIISVKSFSQRYFQYKIDSVAYKASDDDITSYSIIDTDLDEKKMSKSISGDIYFGPGLLYTVEIRLSVDLDKNFQLGPMVLDEHLAFYKTRPVGYIGVTKHNSKDNIDVYQSEKGSKGNITITKIGKGFIEGTFEAILPSLGKNSKAPTVTVTNGKFRITTELM